MDDQNWIVFVSSAMDVGRERQVAVRVAESLGWFKVWSWENSAYPGAFSPDELYLEKAAQADVLVLIIHEKLTANTRREYDTSIANHKWQMIFFKQVERQSSAEEFRKALQSNMSATYWDYKNQGELKTSLGRGLRETFIRLARKGIQTVVGTRQSYSSL